MSDTGDSQVIVGEKQNGIDTTEVARPSSEVDKAQSPPDQTDDPSQGHLDPDTNSPDEKETENAETSKEKAETEIRKSSRERVPTEKGLQMQIEQNKRTFRGLLSATRKGFVTFELLLDSGGDLTVLEARKSELDDLMNEVQEVHSRFTLEDDVKEATDSYDTLISDYQKLLTRLVGIRKDLNRAAHENFTDQLSVHRTKSVRSFGSSRRSRSSRGSSSSSKRAEAVAEMAAAQVRLKNNHLEAQKKRELARVEEELESLKLENELKVAEAKLKALEQATSPDVQPLTSDLQASYRNNEPLSGGLPNTTTHVEDCVRTRTTPECSVLNAQAPPFSPAASFIENSDMVTLIKSIRIPPPEPSVFSGDPLQFAGWKRAFEILIEQRGVPPAERLHYLRRYLSGDAKTAVEGFFFLDSDDAYDRAKALLQKRYGNEFVVSNAFRDKLEAWPNVTYNDGLALRRFADFLTQCLSAIKTVTGLQILNDERENRKMLMKLPDWLISRWNRKVAEHKIKHKTFPSFEVFVSFIDFEAEMACDPVTSVQSLKSRESKTRDAKAKDFKVKDFKTKDTKPKEGTSRTVLNTSVKNDEPKADTPKSCLLCKENHQLDECKKFLKKTTTEKKEVIKKNGLCLGCLTPGHMIKTCRIRKSCTKCERKHPTSLHELDEERLAASSKTTSNHIETCGSYCTMILPVWVSAKGRPDQIMTYALLDTQSDSSFILGELAEELGSVGVPTRLYLSTLASQNEAVMSQRHTDLEVRGFDSTEVIEIPLAYSREIIPAQKEHIPTPRTAAAWPHLSFLQDKLLPLQECKIGLLIGYNCPQALEPKEIVPADGVGPYGQRSVLGWGMVGLINPAETPVDTLGFSHHTRSVEGAESTLVMKTSVKELISTEEVLQLFEQDFGDKEEEDCLSQEDLKFIKLMKTETKQLPNGHYEMPLPLKVDNPNLPDSRQLAANRLRGLSKKLRQNSDFYQKYCAFMTAIIQNGFAEVVPAEEKGLASWYLPHHGVFHAKKIGKLRVVFDASAVWEGTSLNQNLLQGPDMANNLTGILSRFRKGDVAFICDVEQMFFQFNVQPRFRNFLRFLWYPDGNLDADPVDYRMTVHLFGAKSSPACANYGLKQIAEDYEQSYGSDVSDFLKTNFYVDDGLKSTNSVEEAVSLAQGAMAMCQEGGLKLHKFLSNSEEFMRTIPEEQRVHGGSEVLGAQIDRALGVLWCTKDDTLSLQFDASEKPSTRRGVLATISSIYDPLGFVCPVLLSGKKLLQRICKEPLSWDDPLPEEFLTSWEAVKDKLHSLSDFKLNRSYWPGKFGQVVSHELHHFSDASEVGYGQATYLRMSTSTETHCSLVMAKSRVAPLKIVTIPRLELTAAVLSVQVSQFLKRELDVVISREVFWTDSKVVLGYLNNDVRRFKTFVANRVQYIKNHSAPEQWRYIHSEDNPADLASRGLSVDQLKTSCWLQGPKFLCQDELPEVEKVDTEISDDPEIKKTFVGATTVDKATPAFDLQRLQHVSKWSRAIRIVRMCIRLKNKLLRRKEADEVQELDKARLILIKAAQQEAFSEEMSMLEGSDETKHLKRIPRRSKLYKLNPFLDDQGLIRVGGRLESSVLPYEVKHPLVLPKDHRISEMMVRHYHEMVKHGGRGTTMNEIRSNGIWIIGLSRLVRSVISHCTLCRKFRGKVQEQIMSDLPADRLDTAPPFSYCCVDLFGPWYVKNGRKEEKRYGVLFGCLTSRGVHIEVAHSLTTDSFINALRRFMAIRGPIRHLRCDRGTNFIGAMPELNPDKVKNALTEQGCDFVLNVPSSSHAGGVWERQIRSIRSILTGLLNEVGTQLNDEALSTVMHEAAAICNGRPLSVDNLSDPNSLVPLTPSHLITLKSKVLLPPPGNFQKTELYSRKYWKRAQYCLEVFWSRWQKEYLSNLQSRQKWNTTRRNMTNNDIVMIKDDQQPRNCWRLGKVVEVKKGSDGQVRSAKVMIGDRSKGIKSSPDKSYLERPIQKLVLLLEAENVFQGNIPVKEP